ncbi:hypothetical protein Q5752_004908 [Cryptotrichosporon argae]
MTNASNFPTPPGSLSPPSSPSSSATLPLGVVRRQRVRCVLMRAGTSKGMFFRLQDLPEDRARWGPLILAAMGSPDPFLRQLDGMGGGQSTSSKVAVVSVSDDPRADVDYLFIQVPVDGSALDFSGNCGNMASGVGPFAVDEGFVPVKPSGTYEVTVRIRNVNTDRIIHSTFIVEDSVPVEIGSMRLDGVSVGGAPVRLDFVDPAGSMTGKLLPTGRACDTLALAPTHPLAHPRTIEISCVDAANPFVFVLAERLGLTGLVTADSLVALTPVLLEIRARAAVMMGLASTVEAARLIGGTPKIAVVGTPRGYVTLTGREVTADETDLWVRPLSMGRPHPAIQMTGAVCVAVAAAIPGTVVNACLEAGGLVTGREAGAAPVVIGHASGTMAVESQTALLPNGQLDVQCGSVYRTARRLMEGNVLYQQ